jgi:hypothetical protein
VVTLKVAEPSPSPAEEADDEVVESSLQVVAFGGAEGKRVSDKGSVGVEVDLGLVGVTEGGEVFGVREWGRRGGRRRDEAGERRWRTVGE